MIPINSTVYPTHTHVHNGLVSEGFEKIILREIWLMSGFLLGDNINLVTVRELDVIFMRLSVGESLK